MTRRLLLLSGLAILAGASVAVVWRVRGGGDERAIRDRLDDLADFVNASTSDGLGAMAHATELGSFFTPDTTIDFGEGSSPARGRETVIGMAARLQPRTATFRVELDDVNVTLTGASAAEITLTAVFRRRSLTTSEESIDARELALAMAKTEGEWRIAQATLVDTLKR